MTSGFNCIDGVAAAAPVLAGYGALPIGVRTRHLVNPDQIDLTRADLPRHDRALTVEHWYPATKATPPGGHYDTLLRDGATPVRLTGRAARNAEAAEGSFPLVVLSHGYPGNRMLMGHLGETLASRGFQVASIDHTDSTYQDQGAFISTLFNRPLDTRFVADAFNADAYAIIGYSMGGYGALVSAGAGVAVQALANEPSAAAAAVWSAHCRPQVDPRLKAIMPIGAWGRQRGMWDAAGLASLQVPMLLMAGSADAVSGYDDGMRLIFTEATRSARHLLTFAGAGHNAAAPYPAPREAFSPSATLAFLPAEHYADARWDTVQMNGIAQHFAAAFLGLHLQGKTAMAGYLTADLAGFQPGTTAGLRLESLRA